MHLMLARDTKVVIDFPVTARQDGQKGNLLCMVFQCQVSTFKDATAKQVELTLKQTATTATTATTTANPMEREPISGETEANDQEQETKVEEETQEIDERQDAEAREAPPIEKSGPVGWKKYTPCMSTKMALNLVPCMICMNMPYACHVSSKGMSCFEYHKGKVKCSLVQDAGKGKQKTISPPSPSPPPAPVPKPKPKLKLVAPTTYTVRASSKATQVPGPATGTKSKSSDPPTVALPPPQLVPGLLHMQNNAYTELQMSSKWKIVAIEEEASESEDDEEDTYLASRVSGLTNILQMIEMACPIIRKEVEEIDGWYIWNSMMVIMAWVGRDFCILGGQLQQGTGLLNEIQICEWTVHLPVVQLPLGTGPVVRHEFVTLPAAPYGNHTYERSGSDIIGWLPMSQLQVATHN
ncbi:uncharacterized protein HD556DRAFT_1307589 [Suillus plorans]|uniref:Uncharacterized protein n=1 Tax=Suillus plorans TaxID=116603 RepID=A0A9P7DJF2_9AGAM|nr:uncharacterized protein HD556DRAFT_1307589 [Suillus plorans]KAG1795439.1 hypothetical protein HD556DRAFT_1307589 [Suillus plorans]